jgi:EpsI family protein
MEQMKKTDESNRRPVIVAAAAAGFMMLVFGVAYRVVAARLAAPVEATPIAQEVLDRLPLQIGRWKGRDVPLDKAIIRETDTDALVNRRYVHESGLKSVSFYVAAGVRTRDLMPHRPEVCYTGSGWTLVERHAQELSLSDAGKLPCNVFQFSRGALSMQKVVVLYYYIVDGQYYADVSSLRSKAWRGSGAVGYVAQVEIVALITQTLSSDSAEKLVSEFAIESALPTAQLFRDRQEKTEAKE